MRQARTFRGNNKNEIKISLLSPFMTVMDKVERTVASLYFKEELLNDSIVNS